MSMSVDDSGTQRHLLDDSVLGDAVCTSSDSSLPGSGMHSFICPTISVHFSDIF